MITHQVTEFLGDGISDELRRAVQTLSDALPVELKFFPVDLSVERREQEDRKIYDRAHDSIKMTKVALKYPTITQKKSPNVVLRRMFDFSLIHRPVATIPGVQSNFKKALKLDVIRVATGGTYEDPGILIGKDGAVSIRIIEKDPCRKAAIYAFELARKTGKTVTSSSKYTIQKATDGLFQKVVADVAKDYPDVEYRVELFDALLAEIILNPQDFDVIVVPNEYGDFLSDMACGLVGSIGLGASGSYAFDSKGRVRFAMFDPVGGTAPDIAGKDVANPTAAFLALTMLIEHLHEVQTANTVKDCLWDLLKEGKSTRDLGGNLSTTEFTQELISRVK